MFQRKIELFITVIGSFANFFPIMSCYYNVFYDNI